MERRFDLADVRTVVEVDQAVPSLRERVGFRRPLGQCLRNIRERDASEALTSCRFAGRAAAGRD